MEFNKIRMFLFGVSSATISNSSVFRRKSRITEFYVVIFIFCFMIISGCKTPVVEAEEIAPEAYMVDCSEEGAICIKGNPAYEVKSGGKIVGMINLQDGFIFNKYFTYVNLYTNGAIGSGAVIFKNLNCEGDPYRSYGSSDLSPLLYPPLYGRVADVKGELYYHPAGISVFHRFTPKSYYSYHPSTGGRCNASNQSYRTYIKLYPNDPAVTGIETYPFPSVEIVTPKPVLIIEN